MFSGIIEATQNVVNSTVYPGRVRLAVARPKSFDDLRLGDSVAVNGVCLTVEQLSEDQICFSLGAETLKVVDWEINSSLWLTRPLNLERSLRFGDRIHGHLVSGHVEALGTIIKSYAEGESWQLEVAVPMSVGEFLISKGSVTLNGVSLTINTLQKLADAHLLTVCLIPETIKRTNLTKISVGQKITVESDYFTRMLLQKYRAQIPSIEELR